MDNTHIHRHINTYIYTQYTAKQSKPQSVAELGGIGEIHLENLNGMNWVREDKECIDKLKDREAVEGIDYGVVILPPVMNDNNEELDSYPEDYVKYARERMHRFYEENGTVPRYKAEDREDYTKYAEEAKTDF